ncbi:uracil-DNA glycosylase [Pseudaminobacter sp. 19-2017]|uniref:Type-5 uracil-DNA glycosylase n=1 Tax=Pseudaminobacter soli (ex Zhang et al. 2022) TaxID=2831468 RepID=A0A942E3Y8_9HYPH|nr:uracil-DNA glycosylase [Pseudaminobacter soli]
MTPCEPSNDCPLCPRLSAFRHEWREREPDWFNAPVPTFLPPTGEESVRLLIVGLAPGLRGANRTGRPFTGDFAGNLLYSTLVRFGFARGHYEARPDDGLELIDAAITNAVRCVPPENKPTTQEIATCRAFLGPTLSRFPNLKVIVTLGAIAHQSTVRALGGRVAAYPFRHGASAPIADLSLLSSYHCSRYNTNTGVLTEEMFLAVFREASRILQQ